MNKIKLGDVLEVKRGMSLPGEYYATEGDYIRLTLGNFNYPSCGWKKNVLKDNLFFTGNVRDEYILKKGDIIVADKNFGCGSSREHAPIAIKAAGVSCVIAETFARIFYRNAINIGLPIIECPEAVKNIEAGDTVEVNFDTGMIYNRTKGTEYKGQAFPPFMQKIIAAQGLVNYINQK